MIWQYIVLLLPTLTFAGLNIIDSPEEFTWVEQGAEKSLVCTTESGWQWCQWEHTNTNNDITKYQTGQAYSTLQTKDPLISFTDISETTCGIKILEADRNQHDGIWKCHLAYTDDNDATDVDGIRANAYTNLTVAVEATNLAITLTSWFDEEISAESTVTVDDMVQVSCSIDNPDDAHPVPEMVLKAIGG